MNRKYMLVVFILNQPCKIYCHSQCRSYVFHRQMALAEGVKSSLPVLLFTFVFNVDFNDISSIFY